LRSVDNALLYSCFALAIFAFVMGSTVILNLINMTNEVEKLKNEHKKVQIKQRRSIDEMRRIIFGREPTLIDYFIPTKIK